MPSEEVVTSGIFERIGLDGSFYSIKINGEKISAYYEGDEIKDKLK